MAENEGRPQGIVIDPLTELAFVMHELDHHRKHGMALLQEKTILQQRVNGANSDLVEAHARIAFLEAVCAQNNINPDPTPPPEAPEE